MISNRWKLGLGCIFCFAMMANCAQAQDMEDFKKRMGDAAAATKVDLGEALRQYLEIRIEYAGPEVDYSLGRAYQRMNQCSQAQHYYTQVMVAYDLPDDNAIYKRAVNAFDEIAACDAWQKVTVECAVPIGGYAIIDGERISECWDRPYSFSDGEHVLTLVDAQGHKIEKKITTKTGEAPMKISLVFPEKKKVVEKEVEVERRVVEKERFHPALYWGLITGGAAIVAVGGFMGAYAGAAKVDEQKYADLYGRALSESDREIYNKRRKDAHDDVKMRNTVMYTLVGIGGATAITGAILAILSAVSDKEIVELDETSAFVAPSDGGVTFGMGWRF